MAKKSFRRFCIEHLDCVPLEYAGKSIQRSSLIIYLLAQLDIQTLIMYLGYGVDTSKQVLGSVVDFWVRRRMFETIRASTGKIIVTFPVVIKKLDSDDLDEVVNA